MLYFSFTLTPLKPTFIFFQKFLNELKQLTTLINEQLCKVFTLTSFLLILKVIKC
jgi:hypothetical protein